MHDKMVAHGTPRLVFLELGRRQRIAFYQIAKMANDITGAVKRNVSVTTLTSCLEP
jgi:hypothetical protein